MKSKAGLLAFLLAGLVSTRSWATPEQDYLRQESEAEVGCCEDLNTNPLAPKGSTVMLVGDSLAVGMGPTFRSLAKSDGYQPVVHAAVGTTTAYWVSRIEKLLAVHKPSLVVVSLGTNDSTANPDWIARNNAIWAHMTNLITNSGAQVVWIGPPPLHSKRINPVVADEVRKYIMLSVPDYRYFDSVTFDVHRTSDGVHYTPMGYRLWMTSVWQWMDRLNVVNSTIPQETAHDK